MNFVRLYEYNDHEGESWNWWLQVDGNEDDLELFKELLWAAESDLDGYDEFPYELNILDVEEEGIVDKLVEYADSGYCAAHNKVTGKFTCPKDLGENADRLYKGGIKDFFEESQ